MDTIGLWQIPESGPVRLQAVEAFEPFYGLKEADLIAAVGPVREVMLDEAGAKRVVEGLRKLLADREGA